MPGPAGRAQAVVTEHHAADEPQRKSQREQPAATRGRWTDRAISLVPRMAADLRHTTADARSSCLLGGPRGLRHGTEQHHVFLNHPAGSELFTALDAAERQLARYYDREDWDGGAVNLCFAGHGRSGDGALIVAADEGVEAEELADRLAAIAATAPPTGHRLRVSLFLDSCFSAEFLLRFLDSAFTNHRHRIYPYASWASAMPNESAWEDDELGHGVGTYCLSVKPAHPFARVASAVQPDNTYGPSLAIAEGPFGCVLLTGGAQTPARYGEWGELEVPGWREVACFDDRESWRRPGPIRRELRERREQLVEALDALGRYGLPLSRIDRDGFRTDDDVRAAIRGMARAWEERGDRTDELGAPQALVLEPKTQHVHHLQRASSTSPLADNLYGPGRGR